ncbi:ROK family protein [Bacillus sp. YC2]|uniref:ROK family protein n=1 Tax=Bacillus sp. YC2 TaxID=2861287 RepID=UPI001CA6D464|nr:ROK family protein [Bacillus sp. YC2]MBY8911883.1 ROK family protein [Bacillus sp. YC2]
MLGAIEAGGTKFVCAAGNKDGTILDRIEFPTGKPNETLDQVIRYFRNFPIKAIGIGSFGPIDVRPNSKTCGCITATPKTEWRNYPFLQTIKNAFDIPAGFTTDVNAAALGEASFGAAKGSDSCLYLTVGTGIGAGAIMNGRFVQGLSHPEMGHIYVRRHPDDHYKGNCPYHTDCLEGLAAGPAIEKRWGKKAVLLTDKQEVWELEGYYIAEALLQYIYILSPEKIILGGGVMKQKQLFPYIFENVQKLNGKYIDYTQFSDDIGSYIVPPQLGIHSGAAGGLVLAQQALEKAACQGAET